MAILFSYNSVEYWEKSNQKYIWGYRIIGGIYVVAGIAYFYPGWSWAEDNSIWNLILAICCLLGGAINIFQPKFAKFKPKNFGSDFVTIDSEKITWSVGLFRNPNELKFEDIALYKIYIGEIHFTTKDGQIIKLATHKILDKEKHDEFMGLIRNRFL